jgi:hypothetical protein
MDTRAYLLSYYATLSDIKLVALVCYLSAALVLRTLSKSSSVSVQLQDALRLFCSQCVHTTEEITCKHGFAMEDYYRVHFSLLFHWISI